MKELKEIHTYLSMYSARNLEMSIRFSLKFQMSKRLHRPEMSQIKAKISLRTIKIRESIDIIAILHFYGKSTSRWYEG